MAIIKPTPVNKSFETIDIFTATTLYFKVKAVGFNKRLSFGKTQ